MEEKKIKPTKTWRRKKWKENKIEKSLPNIKVRIASAQFLVRPDKWGPPVGLSLSPSPTVRARALRGSDGKTAANKKGPAGHGENGREALLATARRRKVYDQRGRGYRRGGGASRSRAAILRTPRRRRRAAASRPRDAALRPSRRCWRAVGLKAAWRRPPAFLLPLESYGPRGPATPPFCLRGTTGPHTDQLTPKFLHKPEEMTPRTERRKMKFLGSPCPWLKVLYRGIFWGCVGPLSGLKV
jgi:hypothetical protein